MNGDIPKKKAAMLLASAIGTGDTTSVTLQDAWDYYEKHQSRGLSKSTLNHRRGHWRKMVEWVTDLRSEKPTMDSITPELASMYIEYLESSNLKGKTVNNHRGNLVTVWEAVKPMAGINNNPWSITQTVDISDSKQRRDFTDDEVISILAVAKNKHHEWYVLCIMALYTGLRQADLLSLRWKQIDGDLLTITPSKTKRFKKDLMIPLHSRVMDVLDAMPKDGERIFPELSERLRSKKLWRAFSDILRRAKVKAADGVMVDFHCWRHTWKTRLTRAGVHPKYQERLGATEGKEGERYDHDVSQLRKAIDSL
jgi:integrase